MIGLHFFQLWLSALAWRRLLPVARVLRFYRLRIIRESIDSMLPVAQVGGEVVGARMLALDGPTLAASTASVVADVTVEFLTQLCFLLIGLAILAITAPSAEWQAWPGAIALLALGLIVAQRIGVLRIVEWLASQIGQRFGLGASLDGMAWETASIYGRRPAVAYAAVLHLFAWLLGTFESWFILSGLGLPVALWQALVVEALGMAARSAGFAVPGAVVIQETGFTLAAAAVGLPDTAGFALSLVKRVREVAVGLFGLALWRMDRSVTRGRLPEAESR